MMEVEDSHGLRRGTILACHQEGLRKTIKKSVRIVSAPAKI
jgi:hypothetical protein